MLLVEGIPRQSVDCWNVGIKYSPLKRVLPVRYSRIVLRRYGVYY